MTLQIQDRVKETSTTTGTGALTLAGAMTGFRAFSSVCKNSDTCFYTLQAVDGSGNPTGAWETGQGTYTTSGNTLTRTLVLASSTGSVISLAAGTTQVWLDYGAAALHAYEFLQSLTDTSIMTPAVGDLMTWVGASWRNSKLGLGALPSVAGTWNPTGKGTSGTLSANNSVFTSTGIPTGYQGVIGMLPAAERVYFEITVTGSLSQLYMGLTTAGTNVTGSSLTIPGIGLPGFSVAGSNGTTRANSNATSGPTIGATTVSTAIGFAYDVAAGLVWVRIGTGAWMNATLATQDPSNGIGGVAINPGQILYPFCISGTNSNTFTLNMGDQAAFANPPPVGFVGAQVSATLSPADVSVYSPQAGDLLASNGTVWKNTKLALATQAVLTGSWNPVGAGTSTGTLTVNNTLYTSTSGAAGYAGVVGVLPMVGKSYCEITVGGTISTSNLGIAPSTVVVNGSSSNIPGTNTPGAGVWCPTGGATANTGATTGPSLGTIAAGSVVGIAYDAGLNKVWFRIGSGLWFNQALTLQNPATGLGGLQLTAATPLYPFAVTNNNTSTFAINMGDLGAFTNAPPSGFVGVTPTTTVSPADVAIASPADGQLMVYNAASGKWINAAGLVSGLGDVIPPTAYTPTVTAGAGTITTLGAVSGNYYVVGKLVFFAVSITITTNGTGAGNVQFSLPIAAAVSCIFMGRENAVTGNAFQVQCSGSTGACFSLTNGYPGGNGYQLVISGTYRRA